MGDGHRLYFAEYGCGDGPAAVVLHGGPGSSCHAGMLDWFDLSRQRVVLFDQRGAGRSLPAALLTHNRTSDLIGDIERLREHLQITRWMVVGGSWGAALGVLYAGRHPARLSALLLRGVFLTSPREMTWFFQSLQALAPEAWAELTSGWRRAQKDNVLQFLTALLQNGTVEQQRDAATQWRRYENAVMQAMTGAPASPGSVEADPAAVAKYMVQSHYLSQGCFTSERELFRAARNAATVPAILIHGTGDWICPPENAWRLRRFMPQAELRWIDGGTHTPADTAIKAALTQAIRDLG
ncbi:alpha/beta fold hydrolase [Collimonas antrihumi]|uniref:alpha/beta fold hydrolase n=1 Tax=Collimonas antrihumi TaxID=1940615 RepID=UPI001B8AD0C7